MWLYFEIQRCDGSGDSIFLLLHNSYSWVNIMLHTRYRHPWLCGSDLKVTVWVGWDMAGWVGWFICIIMSLPTHVKVDLGSHNIFLFS